MGGTDPRALVAQQAIRRSFEVNATAGSSVNAHSNPFFVSISGSVDLLKAGEAVVKALAEHDETVAKLAANDKPG